MLLWQSCWRYSRTEDHCRVLLHVVHRILPVVDAGPIPQEVHTVLLCARLRRLATILAAFPGLVSDYSMGRGWYTYHHEVNILAGCAGVSLDKKI